MRGPYFKGKEPLVRGTGVIFMGTCKDVASQISASECKPSDFVSGLQIFSMTQTVYIVFPFSRAAPERCRCGKGPVVYVSSQHAER